MGNRFRKNVPTTLEITFQRPSALVTGPVLGTPLPTTSQRCMWRYVENHATKEGLSVLSYYL